MVQERPFALSLSKGLPFSLGVEEVQGFDKLSPNGFRCNWRVCAGAVE
jgi:hypothetical protein